VGDKNICYTVNFTGVNLLVHDKSAKCFRGIHVDLIAIEDKYYMNIRYCSATVGMMLKNWRGQDEGKDSGKDGEKE